MKRLRTATVCLSGVLLGAWAATAAAQQAPAETGADKVWVTDFSGRPPFKRRAVSAAEFARFEETRSATLPVVGERLRVVDTRGRPPFRRQVVVIDADNVAEFARFEEEKPATKERRRFGPPGKGFGRR